MKQFITNRHMRIWLPVEYFVKDLSNEDTVFYAVHKFFWKNWINVYNAKSNDKQKRFSIISRNSLALTHDVIDSENKIVGSIAHKIFLSRHWLVSDTKNDTVAQLVTSLFDHKEHRLDINGQDVCIFTGVSSFFNSTVRTCYLNDLDLDNRLVVALGILLAYQEAGDGGGGGG